MVGLPGAGKTTRARSLAAATGALRLTPDEWHARLFGDDLGHPEHDRRHAEVKALMHEVAAAVLRRGGDVILDFGFWSRAERDGARVLAVGIGAAVRVHHEEVPPEELLRRLTRRSEGRPDILAVFEAKLPRWVAAFEPPGPDELA